MSSTSDTTLTSSNFETLLNASLTEYTEQTGICLRDHPLTSKIDSCDNPESILDIFHEQAQAFDKFRKARLFKWLRPVVKMLNNISIVTRIASPSLVFLPTNAVFSGFLILLSIAMHKGTSYDALIDIFEYIENILRRLWICTDLPLTPTMIERIIKIMLKLLAVLALATEQINQGRFKKYARTFLREKDIESVLRRLDRLTLDESRMTVVQTLDVVHGLINIMLVVMEDGKASIDDIRPPLVLMQNLVLQLNKVERNQLQEKFRRWLSPPDPWVNHNMARKAHHHGTATWFIQGDDFNNWKSKGSLLWIHGLPGSGKTVLCSSIIEDIQAICQIGLANLVFFYFDFHDIGKHDARSLLSSLLIQLCRESDQFSQILSSLYSVHGNGSLLPSSVALMEYLKNILNFSEQGEIYIVMDALDECSNVPGIPTSREQALTIIKELINLRLPHVHFCITSRLEGDIRYVLKALALYEVALYEQAGQNQDIFDYIEYVVSSDPQMRRRRKEDRRLVVKTLTEKGGGMLRWICCQYDTLRRCLPGDIQRTLDELPTALNETYEHTVPEETYEHEHTLRRIDKPNQDFAHRILECLVVCKRPLYVEELVDLLAVQPEVEMIPVFDSMCRRYDPEESVLSLCSTLATVVNVDGKKVVQFSHSSVREYLTSHRIARSENVSRLWVHPRSAHALLARACLGVLFQLDDRIDRDNIQNFPLALYAAQYWVDHARFENVSSDIQYTIERLFDRNKPYFAAWLRLYDVDNPFAFFTTSVYVTRPYPVLYYAALCGFRNVAEHLVDAHPQDLNAQSGTRGTPLHAALDGGHQSVAMLLMGRGADIGCLDSQSRTPLHIACRGCTDVVSVLIDRGVNMNAEDDSRKTPLHVASQWGHDDIVRLLLDHDADADRLDDGGWTPLHVASHEGHYKVVQLLFNHGADANRPDNGGWTPLHLASWEGHERVVRLLLDHGINTNHPDNGGWTPLQAASQEGHNYIVELLLDHGANPNHANSDGSTSLHVALQRNHHYTVQLLLDHGADPDYPNSDGSTSLHLASQRGYDNTVWLLLHHGADANRLNGDGWGLLHLASQRGHYDVVELLLEHGVDSNHKHSNGLTPLHLASQEGHDDIARILLDGGAGANSLNSDGWTPLHLASQRAHDDIVRLLLEHGADSNHEHSNGLTPLHLASQEGHDDIVRILLDGGAGANSLNSDGWTPLHLASQRDHDHIVRLLLEHGADVDHPNSGSLTSTYVASREGGVERKPPEGFAIATRTRRRV